LEIKTPIDVEVELNIGCLELDLWAPGSNVTTIVQVTAPVTNSKAHLKVMEMEHKIIYDVKETHTRTIATKNEDKTHSHNLDSMVDYVLITSEGWPTPREEDKNKKMSRGIQHLKVKIPNFSLTLEGVKSMGSMVKCNNNSSCDGTCDQL
jgi:hypothetical protein